ncbi:NUDIX domain-containing protein [Amycolatopsis anabasis]|uniref:NUDIX domain-containing protein n=1 Tax=Amycolatopsis anabasis TaxID=1840409 RepID=UPI00131B73BA
MDAILRPRQRFPRRPACCSSNGRGRPPGSAPAAGHVDQHGDPEQTARAEVTEEVGRAASSLRLLPTEWRSHRCRRPTTGHVGTSLVDLRSQATGPIRLPASKCGPPGKSTTSTSSNSRTAPRPTPPGNSAWTRSRHSPASSRYRSDSCTRRS